MSLSNVVPRILLPPPPSPSPPPPHHHHYRLHHHLDHWSGDKWVFALHQHLVLRDLPQADPLHRPHHPHRPSCKGTCWGLTTLKSTTNGNVLDTIGRIWFCMKWSPSNRMKISIKMLTIIIKAMKRAQRLRQGKLDQQPNGREEVEEQIENLKFLKANWKVKVSLSEGCWSVEAKENGQNNSASHRYSCSLPRHRIPSSEQL